MPAAILYHGETWYVLRASSTRYYCTRGGEFRWIDMEDAQ